MGEAARRSKRGLVPDWQALQQHAAASSTSLFRFLSSREHCESFVTGAIYLSTLESCRKHPGERGDTGEARHSHLLTHLTGGSNDTRFVQTVGQLGVAIGPGCDNITFRNFRTAHAIEDAYVLCLTYAYSEVMAKRFGSYCVEIFDTNGFIAALNDAVQVEFPMAGGTVGPVLYGTRDGVDHVMPTGPLGFVKPRKYEDEREYRLLWQHREDRAYAPRVFHVPNAQRFCRRIR